MRCGRADLTADLFADAELTLAAYVADALECAFAGVTANTEPPTGYGVRPFDEDDPEIVITVEGVPKYRLALEDYNGPWR